jgi:hypothetical protein
MRGFLARITAMSDLPHLPPAPAAVLGARAPLPRMPWELQP